MVGGVSGIIGNPRLNQRRTEEDLLAVMENISAKDPSQLRLHQGRKTPTETGVETKTSPFH